MSCGCVCRAAVDTAIHAHARKRTWSRTSSTVMSPPRPPDVTTEWPSTWSRASGIGSALPTQPVGGPPDPLAQHRGAGGRGRASAVWSGAESTGERGGIATEHPQGGTGSPEHRPDRPAGPVESAHHNYGRG